jgi:hypothetical protein
MLGMALFAHLHRHSAYAMAIFLPCMPREIRRFLFDFGKGRKIGVIVANLDQDKSEAPIRTPVIRAFSLWK